MDSSSTASTVEGRPAPPGERHCCQWWRHLMAANSLPIVYFDQGLLYLIRYRHWHDERKLRLPEAQHRHLPACQHPYQASLVLQQ